MSTRFVLKQNTLSSQATNEPAVAEYIFDGDFFTIGSDLSNNLVVEKSAPEQAVIIKEGEQITLINSAEGTKINGERLLREAMRPLSVGDEIGIGSYVIAVTDDFEDAFNALTKKSSDTPQANGTGERLAPSKAVSNQPASNETEALETIQEEKPSRNFADILDTLRTEEDSFYFTIKSNEEELGRISLEQAETPIGVDAKGEIASVAGSLSAISAIARKDWSGILIESQKRNAVVINGETVDTIRRLRHNDQITLSASPSFALVLHEPSSLVALESILTPQKNADIDITETSSLIHETSAANTSFLSEEMEDTFFEQKYFNHFNLVEIISMIIATLIGAVLVFLLFEYMFS